MLVINLFILMEIDLLNSVWLPRKPKTRKEKKETKENEILGVIFFINLGHLFNLMNGDPFFSGVLMITSL